MISWCACRQKKILTKDCVRRFNDVGNECTNSIVNQRGHLHVDVVGEESILQQRNNVGTYNPSGLESFVQCSSVPAFSLNCLHGNEKVKPNGRTALVSLSSVFGSCATVSAIN